MRRVRAGGSIAQIAGLALCLVACRPVAPTPAPVSPTPPAAATAELPAPPTEPATPGPTAEALELSGDGHFVSAPLQLPAANPVLTLSHTGPSSFLVEAIQQHQRVT